VHLKIVAKKIVSKCLRTSVEDFINWVQLIISHMVPIKRKKTTVLTSLAVKTSVTRPAFSVPKAVRTSHARPVFLDSKGAEKRSGG